MSRKIDQQDIKRWNSRLSKINLELSLYNECISVFKIYHGFQGHHDRDQCETTPSIHYQFSFSVSEKTLVRFNNILDTFLEDGMYIRLLPKNLPISNNFTITSKRSDFDKFVTTITHKIHNVSYQQRIYNFYNIDLLKVIYFVTCIEDAVNIIQEYFEYEEDGTEICKIKFPGGSIVSTHSDKSGDYMVQNVIFGRNTNDIRYDISKMETKANSEIIIFSDTYQVPESELLPNRDNRLNILLN